jgi:predicted alpha/beta superfamily hydrolase
MPADDAASVAAPARSPVSVTWSTQFDLASDISNRTYRIFVFEPPLPPPEAGYPLLVVLDGNMTFQIAAAMAATYAFAGCPVLVVGVGYAAMPLEMQVLRYRDLTPPTPAEGLPKRFPALGPDSYGGAGAFRRFLTEELRPTIAAAYKVDRGREALFGYSLGGLFVLDTLFNQPHAYRSFIAASPSIWWNERAVLEREPGFVRAVQAGKAAPRVLITVGDREQAPPSRPPPGMSPEDVEALVGEGRMVDNAWELGCRLEKITGDGYHACFHAFEAEDHLTGLAAAVGRALDFALRD